MEEEESRSTLARSIIAIVVAIAVLAAAGGGYYWYTHQPELAPAAAPAPPPPAPAPASQAPASPYAHPIDDKDADHVTPLDQSDGRFLAALAQIKGWRAAFLRMLLPKDLIRHIVATVDALPREKLPVAASPVRPVPGSFAVTTNDTGSTIAPANSLRYTLYVDAFTSLDTVQVVSCYRHFYPLFQQAYRELGYPTGYFNDRLVEVIDQLLDAPEPKPPLAVVAPGAMFHYVDADLEALSAGQKVLVRLGPANENAVKAKLRSLRQAITSP
jgi:hypothetical protein